ncbi:MAG: hypothetical protein U5K37_12315 [Natrialbaceae archaeon]|nr:hypothetical protein [Natrialbaceae archaeon]
MGPDSTSTDRIWDRLENQESDGLPVLFTAIVFAVLIAAGLLLIAGRRNP